MLFLQPRVPWSLSAKASRCCWYPAYIPFIQLLTLLLSFLCLCLRTFSGHGNVLGLEVRSIQELTPRSNASSVGDRNWWMHATAPWSLSFPGRPQWGWAPVFHDGDLDSNSPLIGLATFLVSHCYSLLCASWEHLPNKLLSPNLCLLLELFRPGYPIIASAPSWGSMTGHVHCSFTISPTFFLPQHVTKMV